MISRRNFIFASFSLAGVSIGYGLYREKDFLRDLLEDILGPFEMSDVDFAAFKSDFMNNPANINRPKKYYGAYLIWSVDGLISPPSESINQKYEEYKRQLITEFITSTMWVQSKNKKLKYYRFKVPCSNPFADLS